MFSKFGSVDEVVIALESSKFIAVGIPYDWTFGGTIRIEEGKPDVVIVKGNRYQIIARLETFKVLVIKVPRIG